MRRIVCVALFLLGFLSQSQSLKLSTVANLQKTLKTLVSSTAIIGSLSPPAFAELIATPWNNNVQYEVLQAAPSGAVPKPGDLVAIRFLASYNGQTIDDTLKTADPYYFRCGVGAVVQGLDEAVTHMHEGERVKLRFGGDLAFGQKGMKSAPGRARVPPNAVVDYEVCLRQ